jgi:hypothetical protein
MSRSLCLLLAAAGWFAALVSSAAADVPLPYYISSLTKDVVRVAKERGETTIAVGQFSADPRLVANGGPGITRRLIDELRREGLTISPRTAKLAVEGKYRLDQTDRPIVVIEGQIVDEAGQKVADLKASAFDEDDVAQLTGTTINLLQNGPRSDFNGFKKAIKDGEAQVRGTRVTAGGQSPYGVEIVVKGGGSDQPREPQLEDGLVYVPIAKGDVYGVRLINDSPYDAAVRVSIDGLNSFTFSEMKEYKHYIVRARSAVTVRGWHRNNEVSDSFQVTSYAKSAVAQAMPNSTSVGMISATFAAAWTDREPADEPREKELTLGSSMDQATGRGARVQQRFQEVRRQTGVPRAVIVVRYEKPAADPVPTPTPTPTPSGDVTHVVVAASQAPVMSGAQTLGMVAQGEQLALEERQGDWIKVARPAALLTTRGWIHKRDVETIGSFDAAAIERVKVTSPRAAVMSGTRQVATLVQNDFHKVHNTNGDWFEITVPQDQDALTGWIRATDLQPTPPPTP